MKRVVIESPFGSNTDGSRADAATIERNKRYLVACIRDSLRRGEAPWASHGFYTQPGILDDGVPEQRRIGMEAGFVWGAAAHLVAIYTDLGITPGMTEGYMRHARLGIPVEYRKVEGWDG